MMTQRFWLPLLVTSAIVASPLWAEKLPEPKKPGFRGCGTYLLKGDEEIAENMPEILFCIDKQKEAKADGKKIPDPNFVSELKKGVVTKSLQEDYEGKESGKYVAAIAEITGKGGGKTARDAVRNKNKAKADIKSAKAEGKSASKAAYDDMVSSLSDIQGLAKASGIKPIPSSRKRYGSKSVPPLSFTQKGKVKAGVYSASAAQDQTLASLTFLKTVVDSLAQDPQKIVKNPKFLNELKKSLKTYWSTKKAYDKLNKEGYEMLRDFVQTASALTQASQTYISDLESKSTSANEKLQDAKRREDSAKSDIKGDSDDSGEDEENIAEDNDAEEDAPISKKKSSMKMDLDEEDEDNGMRKIDLDDEE